MSANRIPGSAYPLLEDGEIEQDPDDAVGREIEQEDIMDLRGPVQGVLCLLQQGEITRTKAAEALHGILACSTFPSNLPWSKLDWNHGDDGDRDPLHLAARVVVLEGLLERCVRVLESASSTKPWPKYSVTPEAQAALASPFPVVKALKEVALSAAALRDYEDDGADEDWSGWDSRFERMHDAVDRLRSELPFFSGEDS